MMPKPSPTINQEIGTMLSLGFIIDRWIVDQKHEVSSDPEIRASIVEGLERISKLTLNRVNDLMHNNGY